MSALVIILPVIARPVCSQVETPSPCRRCGGARKLTFDRLSPREQRLAGFGSLHPCPACGEDAEIIPFKQLSHNERGAR